MPATDTAWHDAVDYAAASDLGLRRANNQDSYVVVVTPERNEWLRRGHLFMVADGMGAHAAGELASKMATDFISLTYYKAPDESPVDAVRGAFSDANERIYTRGQSNPDFRGMGTTASVLLLLPEGAVVAHVGDSRVYRLRAGLLEQLSFDHSLVWEMQAIGKLRPEELNVPKNIITRSLGPYPQVQVDLEGPFPLAVGDTFLLCSDGLSGQVEDEEMGCILAALPPAEAVQALVDLANLRGGPDNITVIVGRVAGADIIGGGVDMSPAEARRAPGRRTVHLGWWIALGVLVLASLTMTLVQRFIVAGATAAAAVLVALWIALQRTSAAGDGQIGQGQLGKAPYRATYCEANSRVVEQLAKVVNQLRAAAAEEHWQVDWDRFNAYSQRAAAADREKNYQQNVREHCHAISFMMEELRQQPLRKNGDGASEG
ncbi:MAG: serine/threonine-protein phosphatase [Planctomycetia bacterium]|nr:serine/threonine-protein phosphatase [Planctomycetia bacterium]